MSFVTDTIQESPQKLRTDTKSHTRGIQLSVSDSFMEQPL